MKIAILLVLAVALNAVQVDLNRSTQKHVDALMKTNWGQTILQLAELHATTGGVLQDLVGAIEEMVQQMQDELDDVEYNFGIRTNEHNALSLSYQQELQDADIDIQRSADTVENLLYPRRQQIKEKIQQLVDYQEFNRKTVDEETLIREQEHEAFEAQIAEYNDAVAATDDALNLLQTLTNPSLVQIQKFQSNLRKIEARIKPHSQHQTLIKALITLAAEQNFSDQGIIGQIVGKLNEFRNAVVDAINAATAQEAEDVQEYEERIQQLNDEYAEFQRQIVKATVQLNATQEKIEQLLSFQAQRQSDRNTAQQLFDLENEQYADDTQIYTDLKNKLQRDIAVTEEAFNLVKSVDFSKIKV